MSATWLGIFLFLAFLPTHGGQASEARAKLKAPIQPDETATQVSTLQHDQPSKRIKPAKPKSAPTARAPQKKRAVAAEIPGQLSFSTFAIGGYVNEPRVTFVLEPIPLEMVDEPFALDYHQRVKDGAARKDLGL